MSNVLKAPSSGALLVHCAMGKPRSASIVIAYIMREEGLSYEDALAAVQSIRRVVQPNTGFSHQLQWYGDNGCPVNLLDKTNGMHYTKLPQFKHLLRKYTKQDVQSLVLAAGV